MASKTMSLEKLESSIENIYDRPQSKSLSIAEKKVIKHALHLLDTGLLRVATQAGTIFHPESGTSPHQWIIQEWAKKVVLLSFQLFPLKQMKSGELTYFDKIPVKKWTHKNGVRAIPPAIARQSSYVAPGVVLMPSFINVGAYVDAGTMVDTWATVGSCAQVGKYCHLSGGVGLGGVLEPIQARPVILEDHVFVGSRAVIVEGVQVCEGSVLGAGVVLTASTPIIDVRKQVSAKENPKTWKGLIPPFSVVIPGSREKEFPGGTFSVPCALIIGTRNSKTEQKISLNHALREFDVPV